MDKKIKNLIKNSGMITHHKVVEILRQEDWKVLVSPYYYDNITEKTKEIDIIAEKQIPIIDFPGDRTDNFLGVQLFIECKYIDQEIIFWFDEIDKEKAADKIEEDFNLKIAGEGRGGGDATFSDFHYLEAEKVAKLFSTNANKDDVIYKALSQTLNSMIHYREYSSRSIVGKDLYKIIRYPIIVCDNFNKLLEINFKNDKYDNPKSMTENFLLEVNYTTSKNVRNDYFLIDVVKMDGIKFLLEQILNKDIKPFIEKTRYEISMRNTGSQLINNPAR